MSLDFQNAQLPRLIPLEGSLAENEVLRADLRRFSSFCWRPCGRFVRRDVLGAGRISASLIWCARRSRPTAWYCCKATVKRRQRATCTRPGSLATFKGAARIPCAPTCKCCSPTNARWSSFGTTRKAHTRRRSTPRNPSFAWWLHQVGEDGVKLDGSWGLGRRIVGADESRANRKVNTAGMFLTSRILISLDFSVNTRSIASLIHIIRCGYPGAPAARVPVLVAHCLRCIRFDGLRAGDGQDHTNSLPVVRPGYHRGERRPLEARYRRRAGAPPSPFGSFKLGKLEGGKVDWHLKSCRASGLADVEITGDALVLASRNDTGRS